ncbi:MAG: SCP2 sterol-binding domain-containing protein [Chloroflexi bacterium]|nr:SCP2 sterol-binding domain-containing protein [Chloroflexota bacterium]
MPYTKEQVAGIFPSMVARFLPEKADGVDAIVQFDLAGDNGGQWWLRIANGVCEHGDGAAEAPKLTIKANADDYYAVATGAMNPMQAYMGGKLKIQGDMGLAMKFMAMFAN